MAVTAEVPPTPVLTVEPVPADPAAPAPALTDAAAAEPPATEPPATEPPASVNRAPAPRRRWIPRPVVHIGRLLIFALVVEYLVVPNIAGTHEALNVLGSVNPFLLLLGVALEAGAITAYALLTRTVLGPGRAPGLWTTIRIQLTTLSVSHVVPGGSAAGSSLGYRLYKQAGVKGTDVGFALATQALGSAVVLNVVFWIALVVSIPVRGFSPLYLTAALAGVALVVLFVTLVLLMTRGSRWLGTLIERSAARIPFVRADVARDLFDQLAARAAQLGAERTMLGKALGWALANWLLDAASLWVFVGAFGHWADPDGLLVAYGLANVLAAIPLTPGGLGVVEATLTSTLVGFGSTRAIAILGVLTYRFVNFWLPIPLGGLTYLTLQVDPGHTDRAVRLAHLRNVRSWVLGPVEAWRRRGCQRRGQAAC